MADKAPAFRGLTSRFLGVLALLVLAGSLSLIAALHLLEQRRESAAFIQKARDNAAFIERLALPKSPQLAAQLSTLLGAQVYFQSGQNPWIAAPGAPPLPISLNPNPDSTISLPDRSMAAVAPLGPDLRMALVSPAPGLPPSAFAGPAMLAAVAVFTLLALATGWYLARSLILPLRSLAAALPRVASLTDFPESSRPDEIGELARTLAATGAALRNERAQREQAERFVVLGRMAASMAHEVRNPVSAIDLHAQLLSENARPEDQASLDCIARESAKIEDLVQQWMLLARPAPPATSDVRADVLLAQSAEALRPAALRARVTLSISTPDTPITIRGDHLRLSQALSNILRNALHAAPENSTVCATLTTTPDSAVFSIRDHGPGFSPLALAHWADPFFSTKEGGMGIGLTVAREVTSAHGGNLSVSNPPDGGALVSLSLPISPSS
jgi:signal transduction histidine kinase